MLRIQANSWGTRAGGLLAGLLYACLVTVQTGWAQGPALRPWSSDAGQANGAQSHGTQPNGALSSDWTMAVESPTWSPELRGNQRWLNATGGGWQPIVPPFAAASYAAARASSYPVAPGQRPVAGPDLQLANYFQPAPVPPEEVPGPGPPRGPGQPLGQAPVDTSQLFLRASTVLLEPGDVQWDYGFIYQWFDTPTLNLTNNNLTLGRARLRQWFAPLEIRWGWTRYLQPFVNVPVGYAHFQRDDPTTHSETSIGGIGDISFGFNYLLFPSAGACPDVIFGFSTTAPTGQEPFSASPDVASLGNGFWGVSANLNFVKSIDPAVLFWGFGYAHEFARSYDFGPMNRGARIRPGEVLFYQFGTGFAINDSLTCSSTFIGSFQGRLNVDGVPVPNSSFEQFAIRSAVTIRTSAYTIIEPFVRYGLNDDTPEATFGIVFTDFIYKCHCQ